MKTVPLISVQVRRDAMTMLPVAVPSHELRVLRVVHGKDNVYPSDIEAGSVEIDPEKEAERLAGKYGLDKIVAAYGEGYEELIPDAISSNDATGKGKARAAATA